MKNKGYFIEPRLLADIEHKRDTLMNKISDESGIRTALFSAASLDAAYHSKITEPDQASGARKIGRKRDFRDAKGNLEEARDYSDKEYNGVITKPFLLKFANIIEPSIKQCYRTENAIISGYGDMAVNPMKIDEEMDALMGIINGSSIGPVEKAVLFHLHCLRIHPFADGNGRTSRAVQNLILVKNHYTPAVLLPAERTFYNDLISEARADFKLRGSGDIRAPELMAIPPKPNSSESKFLHYMATKINVGMDKLIGDYESMPHYEIRLPKLKDPGELMRLKGILTSHFKYLGLPAHISVTNLKNGRLELRADTNDCLLVKLLDKKLNSRYKITRFD